MSRHHQGDIAVVTHLIADVTSFTCRSNRMKSSGHRPVTQERMMSTSWSGSGQMYPPPQGSHLTVCRFISYILNVSAAAKLGASLVMPPPSQTNTLRKPTASQDVTVAGCNKNVLIPFSESKSFQFTHSAMRRASPCLTGLKFQPRTLLSDRLKIFFLRRAPSGE